MRVTGASPGQMKALRANLPDMKPDAIAEGLSLVSAIRAV